MNKLTITTEEDLEHIAKTAYYLLSNLRKATVKWEAEHGAVDKYLKKGWEEKADQFLRAPLEIKFHHVEREVKIVKE